ncbi:acetyltransferase [Paenibacillus sp. 1P07SE]|uniref:acetyltransferase n=1 Tax=Paenibacillus sp. 1P07SE TaxID=3132209 RepID=UPI0039A468C5
MKKKLLIVGAGGHAKVLADIAFLMGKWEQIVFADDRLSGKQLGFQVIARTDELDDYVNEYDMVVGIGDNYLRESIQMRLAQVGATIPVLIHPKAILGSEISIGEGSVIMAGAIINCSTKIGKGSIINTSSTIDHDCIVGDFGHLSPGVHLAGTVQIGRRTWLGIGSLVNNGVSISENCVIGAGAVVIRVLTEPGTYVGIPARRVK